MLFSYGDNTKHGTFSILGITQNVVISTVLLVGCLGVDRTACGVPGVTSVPAGATHHPQPHTGVSLYCPHLHWSSRLLPLLPQTRSGKQVLQPLE